MMRVEQIGNATLYLGDCREVLPTLGRVDAVVTSPPYAQQRDYGRPIEDWTSTVGTLAGVSENAQILINLGLIYRDGEVVEYWEGLKDTMRSSGWRLFGWYVWDKGFGMPSGDQKNRPITAHEWVFHFNRKPSPINKWVRSTDRTIPGRGIRQADGTFKGITSPEKYGQTFRAPDTVIRMPPHQARGGIENDHPAIFPVELPSHLIQTHSDPGNTVLDPFLGSGTTGVSCAKLGRSFIGIEIEEKYHSIACRRIEAAQRQADLFVSAAPAPAHTTPDMFAEPPV